jgi:hypothetical protein
MKVVLSRALLGLVLALATYDLGYAAQAGGVSPMDGIWASGTRTQTEQVSLQVDLLGDLGRLKFTKQVWTNGTSATCLYLFDHEGGTVKTTAFNLTESQGACPLQLSLALKLENESTLQLQPSDDFIPTVALQKLFGPVEAARMSRLPDNFDILGASPGMSQTDIEKILRDAGGYAEDPAFERKWGNQDAVNRVVMYKKAGAKQKSYGMPADFVTVVYSTAPVQVTDQPLHAIIVSREWNIAPEDQIVYTTLVSALNDKYGEPNSVQGELSARLYDREGARLQEQQYPNNVCPLKDNQRAAQNIYQYNFDATRSRGGFRGQARPDCGSVVETVARGSSQNGMANYLDITLINHDIIINDTWARFRMQAEREISTFLKGVSSANKKPKL